MLSKLRSQSLDLGIVNLLALGAVLSISIGAAAGMPRLILGVLMSLILPGYALSVALFPTRRFRPEEHALLSVGLSLTALVLVGLLLNSLMITLQAVSWAWALALFIIIASAVALFRRLKQFPENWRLPAFRFKATSVQLIMIGLAVILTLTSIGLVSLPLSVAGMEGYTQLWMLAPRNGYPGAVSIGISSSELTTSSYRMELTADGQPVAVWPSFYLVPGQTWETSAELPAQAAGEHIVRLRLYRLDKPTEVYRMAQLWWYQGDRLGK